MQIVAMLSGPVIGAVIGYFTNYIAVKMLFHPRNPVKIGKYTLPFTPGIIPGRKKDLARAIGHTVEDELFGANEVRRILLDEKTEEAVAGGIAKEVENVLNSEESMGSMLSGVMGEEKYEEKKKCLQSMVTDRITDRIGQMNLGHLLMDKGADVIRQVISNPFVAMFLTPDLLHSFEEPINEHVNQWLEAEGKAVIQGYVEEETENLTEKPLKELIGESDQYMPAVKSALCRAYEHFVENNADSVVKQFRIQEIIEERIAAMSNESLEEMILSVMKNELGMIVKLGAVIGFVIGILNNFI